MFVLAARAFQRQRVGAGIRQFGARPREVELADVPGRHAAVENPDPFLAQPDRLADDFALGIDLAREEVGPGDVCLQGQFQRFVERLLRGEIRFGCPHAVAHAAEEVHLVTRGQRRLVELVGRQAADPAEAGHDAGRLCPRRARAEIDARQSRGLGTLHEGPALFDAFRGRQQVLVRGAGLDHQRGQHRVAEDAPPLAAVDGIRRRGFLPLALDGGQGLLVRDRQRHLGRRERRCERTAAEGEADAGEDERLPDHAPRSSGACTTGGGGGRFASST
jgi:hypothetical protein